MMNDMYSFSKPNGMMHDKDCPCSCCCAMRYRESARYDAYDDDPVYAASGMNRNNWGFPERFRDDDRRDEDERMRHMMRDRMNRDERMNRRY